MNNVLLGKTMKAMYKLSGKTLTQLADETGLTIDTINNLFYARIQKPGLAGVNTLVEAMGFSLRQLMDFMDSIDRNPDLPESSDITELFTQYIAGAADAVIAVTAAELPAEDTKRTLSAEIELLNAEHEKQLDRFRATHQRYVAQLQEQHSRQIEQMKEHYDQMEQHFDHSVAVLTDMHAQELARMEKDNLRIRKTLKWLALAFTVETFLFLLLMLMDMFNRSIGWMR